MALNSYNVTIIGGGITGYSTLWHLYRKGIKRLALIQPPSLEVTTEKICGMVTGGQFDNFTRLSHCFGLQEAVELWHWGNSAFQSLINYCQNRGIPSHTNQRIRIIVTDDEHREVMQAHSQLLQAGFESQYISPNISNNFHFSPIVKSLHLTGQTAGWVEISSLLKELKNVPHRKILHTAVQITSESGKVSIKLDNQDEIFSELVVCACHSGIGAIIPELREALVTYEDQWQKYKFKKNHRIPLGTIFSARHGYEWGGVLNDNEIFLGGGRFLRHLAGIGATRAEFKEKIAVHLLASFAKYFSLPLDEINMISGWAGLEIRPCDEKPIIGPMFGDNNILLATGFSNQGLTFGFHAGYCLSELIETGKCSELPRCLWPERLRTLSSTN